MSEADTNAMPPSGAITWTEIPSVNLPRAQKFYEDVFGWSCNPIPAICPETGKQLDEAKVVLFTKGPAHGSLVKIEEDNHLSPAKHPKNAEKTKMSVCVTITTESIDESVNLIQKAGGKLYKPKTAIPGNMGFIAYFTDLDENVMGIWSMK